MLVRKGLVSDADVETALALQAQAGGLIGQILVRTGALSESRLLEVLSEQLGLAVLTSDDLPGLEAVRAFAAETGLVTDWWRERQAFAWRAEDGGVLCAAVHPLDPILTEKLEQVSDSVRFHLCARGAADALLADLDSGARRDLPMTGPADAARLRELAQETPVVDFVNGLFAEALARRASDVHVEAFETHFVVRLRIDGVLVTVRKAPRAGFDAVCSRIKLLSGMDIGERRLPQDGRQSIRVSGQEMDLRVSTLPATWGESLVLRLLGKSTKLPELSALGVSTLQESRLLRMVEQPNGVVLITGPTGSGKTTTIYRLLTHLNDGVRKIVTVEDPVEVDLPGAVQVHVRSDIGLTFAAGLRSILRQDPDVIMIGEIRDPETARIAVQAALTGHMVISTVHTNTALAAVSRLMDLGVEPYLLADVVRGMVGQRLVRRLCPQCSRPSSGPEIEKHEALVRASTEGLTPPAGWREPVGCDACAHTGYMGRIGIYEIAAVSPELERGVRDQAEEGVLTELARADGFQTMFEDGLGKARHGLTSLSEVYRAAGHQDGSGVPADDAA